MDEPNLFRVLVSKRHWQQYQTFKHKFEAAARELSVAEGDRRLANVSVGERQFARWMYGEVKGAPRPDACRILEHLLGHSVTALFGPASADAAEEPTSKASPSARESTPRIESEPSDHDAVMAAARESARFAGVAERSNVGPHTLEQLRSDIQRIVTTYPNRPVVPLFFEVRELRDRAFELLEGRQPPRYTRDLYLAAGLLCGILANASFDLGRFAAAETQARTAFLCGELAGSNALRSWVRGMQSLIAYWDDRPVDAVALARAGQHFVPEQGTAAVRLAGLEARAAARLQDDTGTNAALHRTAEAREASRGDDEPGGMLAFPVEKQLMYASTAHLWIGGAARLREAESEASEAVCIYEDAPPEMRRLGELSLARIDLASVRLARGDLEGAVEQAREVLAASARRRTDSVTRRLLQFRSRLELPRFRGTQAAAVLRDEIRSFSAQRLALPMGCAG